MLGEELRCLLDHLGASQTGYTGEACFVSHANLPEAGAFFLLLWKRAGLLLLGQLALDLHLVRFGVWLLELGLRFDHRLLHSGCVLLQPLRLRLLGPKHVRLDLWWLQAFLLQRIRQY